MHPVGQAWFGVHPNYAEAYPTECQLCHGTDYRGTVLSRMLATRTINGQTLFQGAIVSCYGCHNGPGGSGAAPAAPTVANVVTNTTNDQFVNIPLPMTGTNLTPRIITQATNGTVGINTNTLVATYFPNPGFVGTDAFTFAAYNASRNSSLATATVTVTQGPCSIGATAYVPPSYPAQWPAAFTVVPSVTNNAAPASFNWDFGDGSVHSTNQYAPHPYALPGSYHWTVTSTVSTASTVNSGTIVIGNPVQLSFVSAAGQVTVSWTNTIADTLLEASSALGPSAHWQWVTNIPTLSSGMLSVTLPAIGPEFLRVRRPW
jgi:PKD repeat protein